jgi:hypothetical protein
VANGDLRRRNRSPDSAVAKCPTGVDVPGPAMPWVEKEGANEMKAESGNK